MVMSGGFAYDYRMSNDADGLLPDSPVPGLVPTMNNTGWMTESLDEISTDFTRYAGTIDAEVLDIGCAYGIATLAALEAGARVLGQRHRPAPHRDPRASRAGSTCATGCVARPACCRTSISLPERSARCSRHACCISCPARTLNLTVRKIHDWLQPGGRAFLVVDSPYTGPWRIYADEYERRKAAGDPWPGLVDDYAQFLSAGTDPSLHPDFINPMDSDTLVRVCEMRRDSTMLDVTIPARWHADRDRPRACGRSSRKVTPDRGQTFQV